MTVVEACLIVGTATNTIGVFFGLMVSMRNSGKIDRTSGNIQKIELATNSMKDALVRATGEAAHAAGLAEGKEQSK